MRYILSLCSKLQGGAFASRRSASNYVESARRQELIQNDDKTCRQNLAEGKFLLMCDGQPLLSKRTRDIAWTDYEGALAANPRLEEAFVFLGLESTSGEALFALSATDEAEALRGRCEEVRFVDLRKAVFFMDEDRASSLPRLSRAWSMLRWHRKSGFCSNCGARSVRNFSGSHRSCPSCGEVHYPRTSPVGIVLPASPSPERGVLLIRQPAYPPGMYSCVAGFADVGESLEDCVRREVAEEVGMEVSDVRVRGSQHWPYPDGSLMVGCEARLLAGGDEPTVDGHEIEEARWFSPHQLREAFERSRTNPKIRLDGDNSPDNVFVPPRQAIAHHLIKAWLQENGHL